jgi:dual specificity tyrosine-phosphorylation-regulated kinase 2/3/4
MSPKQALKLFSGNMSPYEKVEILEYKNIYFIGLKSEKVAGSPLHAHNYGFDDERGDYLAVMKDHLGFRFEVMGTLGRGSFG